MFMPLFIGPASGGDMGGGGGIAKDREGSLCTLEYMLGGGGGGPFRVPGLLESKTEGETAEGARVAVDARGRKPEALAKFADR